MLPATPTHESKAGLLHWAQRALEECDKASQDFAPDPVHDLRVALRRCRSMADGFRSIDPDPEWKQMKDLGKALFASLGELRDTQVMQEWVTKLSAEDDPVRNLLLEVLRPREEQQKKAAQHALNNFDRKRWSELNARLESRARKVPLEGIVFQFIALERLLDARALHRQALRNRSQTAYHQLRIGIKRFRYTVENFLPERHARWSKDLRILQDSLGEVHDFDVLWFMVKSQAGITREERQRWRQALSVERDQRLNIYRQKMVGRQSLWSVWQSDLPAGERREAASLEKLRTWATFLDPHHKHAERTLRLSLALYDKLAADGVLQAWDGSRRILEAAAILHEIGRSKQEAGHEKRGYRMIRKISPPLGWSEEEMHCVAIVARYHRGGLPPSDHAIFAGLSAKRRRELLPLAGILRLANALDLQVMPPGAQFTIGRRGNALVLELSDFDHSISQAGQRLAKAKYLLEASCRMPILIETGGTTSRGAAPANNPSQ